MESTEIKLESEEIDVKITSVNLLEDDVKITSIDVLPDQEEPIAKAIPPRSKTIGVVYLAFGDKYVKEAILSARSFKKFHPRIPITVHTNKPKVMQKYKKLFHRVRAVPNKPVKTKGYKVAPYAKLNKIKAMASFPYDITLYLDCDTTIRGRIRELFELGKKHDICIANSPLLDKTKRPFKLVSYRRPKAYNSGVIVFQKNPRVVKLFREWLALCQKDKNIFLKNKGKFYDQPKLVLLLNRPDSEIDLKVIPNTVYNVRHTMLARVKRDRLFSKVKIVHKHNQK